MKSVVAAIFLATVLVAAEPPRPSLRQTALDDAPYEPSGWRPNGPLLQLPARNNNLQETYGAPPSLYGPPKNESEETTTESITEPTTTLLPRIENLKAAPSPAKLQQKKSEKLTASSQPNQFYFIVNPPQSQKLILAAPLRVVNTEARRNPAPARLEEFPQAVEVEQAVPLQVEQVQTFPVQYEQVQTVPVLSGYVSQSQVVTPYSSSFVQIYQ